MVPGNSGGSAQTGPPREQKAPSCPGLLLWEQTDELRGGGECIEHRVIALHDIDKHGQENKGEHPIVTLLTPF